MALQESGSREVKNNGLGPALPWGGSRERESPAGHHFLPSLEEKAFTDTATKPHGSKNNPEIRKENGRKLNPKIRDEARNQSTHWRGVIRTQLRLRWL